MKAVDQGQASTYWWPRRDAQFSHSNKHSVGSPRIHYTQPNHFQRLGGSCSSTSWDPQWQLNTPFEWLFAKSVRLQCRRSRVRLATFSDALCKWCRWLWSSLYNCVFVNGTRSLVLIDTTIYNFEFPHPPSQLAPAGNKYGTCYTERTNTKREAGKVLLLKILNINSAPLYLI